MHLIEAISTGNAGYYLVNQAFDEKESAWLLLIFIVKYSIIGVALRAVVPV